ncbi:hypothetical protein [Paenibacillus chibensis]|uniref:hypothetical protein n=1 Tax=Paenibacillus chibensis TaxID=59846 RepID=UPI0013E2D3A8|nr:hypothetical protein [Paenibacillus chibensis]
MIVTIGYVLGVLILAAAGWLAWRNSRIIADQRKAKGAIPAVSSYTVQVTRQSDGNESARMTPLLEAVYQEPQGSVRVSLCRVNGTISELKLDHAVQIMEHTCSEFSLKGEAVNIAPFRESVRNEEEDAALSRLEQALTFQRTQA